MYFSILIPPPPDRTKYMLLGHSYLFFCFLTFSVHIDIEKKKKIFIYSELLEEIQ